MSAEDISAGAFGPWLKAFGDSLRGDGGADVPCGDCVGCCVSSYYIPIRLRDADARMRIPSQYLAQANGQPPGEYMMTYLDDGLCPMLKCGKCSIYEHRPQTCRDYDCRVFAAAGIEAGPDKAVINRRVRAWRFTYGSDDERRAHDAVRAAAHFIQAHRDAFPGGRAPTAPTGIAVLAIKCHSLFMDAHTRSHSAEDLAMAVIQASAAFDAGS